MEHGREAVVAQSGVGHGGGENAADEILGESKVLEFGRDGDAEFEARGRGESGLLRNKVGSSTPRAALRIV